MEGDLKVSPGAKLKAGYDFTLPKNKNTFTVSFTEGKVVFTARCVSGKPPSVRAINARDSAWSALRWLAMR